MELQPVHVVANHYGLDTGPFIRGIRKGRIGGLKYRGTYYTSVELVASAVRERQRGGSVPGR